MACDHGPVSGGGGYPLRKEQPVSGLLRSTRGWQAEEVKSGHGSEQMGLPDPGSHSGRRESGRGELCWGHPAGQFKARSTSKHPSDLGGVSSPLRCIPSLLVSGSPPGKPASRIKKLAFNWALLTRDSWDRSSAALLFQRRWLGWLCDLGEDTPVSFLSCKIGTTVPSLGSFCED